MKRLFLSLFLLLTVAASAFTVHAEEGIKQLPAVGLAEEEGPVFSVGTAIRDITPTEENGMLPIAAVGRTTAEGVIDPLHLRVISLSDETNTALIVSIETGKGPYGPLFAAELSEHTGIPLDGIFYTATHAHATPEITDTIDMSYITFEEGDEVDNLQKWGRLVYDQMMDAADEALASMVPAKMGIGYTDSYVNVNRQQLYTAEDGRFTRPMLSFPMQSGPSH